MGLLDLFNDDEARPVAVFQFESGTLCPVCGKYHADQWQCDPSIPKGEE